MLYRCLSMTPYYCRKIYNLLKAIVSGRSVKEIGDLELPSILHAFMAAEFYLRLFSRLSRIL